MMCLNPVKAYFNPFNPTNKNGRLNLRFHPKDGIRLNFDLPCGKCDLCRHQKFKEWSRRLQLEAFDLPSTFLTLTFDEAHLNPPSKRDVQLFLKRFRQLSRKGLDLSRFKYFFVSELGSRTKRPHYHAILFGVDCLRNPFFETYLASYKVGKNGKRYPIYASKMIESVWDKGFNTVDVCTSANIRYVAKYISKNLGNGDDNYFRLFSRRIGTRLFMSRDCKTVLPFGRSTFVSGKYLLDRSSFPVASPSFLDRYMMLSDESLYKAVKEKRRIFASNFKQDVAIVKSLQRDILSKQQAQLRNEIL